MEGPRVMKKVVVDFNVDVPEGLESVTANIVRDYIHLFRFTIGIAEVSIYPLNTKVVHNPISLESNLSDMKH